MKTILIIDDEFDLCSLLKRVLVYENYSVECAFTLAEASKKLSERPSVVLLDNNLPDGRGIQFFREHLTDFENSYVILISADVNLQSIKTAEQEGLDAFIQKPFSIKNIRDLIRLVA